jgi:hypothetical protein
MILVKIETVIFKNIDMYRSIRGASVIKKMLKN